jgi:hypothetical protein
MRAYCILKKLKEEMEFVIKDLENRRENYYGKL